MWKVYWKTKTRTSSTYSALIICCHWRYLYFWVFSKDCYNMVLF